MVRSRCCFPVGLGEPAGDLIVDVGDTMQLDVVHPHRRGTSPEAGAAVTALTEIEPFPLVAAPVRLAAHLRQRSIVTVTTNVPGPRTPLYGLGRRVVEIIPYVPITSTLRTGVAVFTYCGRLTFGITGDFDAAEDVTVLARGIEQGLADLVVAAGAATGSEAAASG